MSVKNRMIEEAIAAEERGEHVEGVLGGIARGYVKQTRQQWLEAQLRQITGGVARDSLTAHCQQNMDDDIWAALHPLERLRAAQEVLAAVERQFVCSYGARLDCRIVDPIMPYAQIKAWDRHFTLIYDGSAMTIKTREEPNADWEFESIENQLRVAALQYSRECGWDMAPSPESGLWVLRFKMYDIYDYAVTPENAQHGDKATRGITGLMVGFAVLQDRNGDGTYESLAHMWTAQTERRRGHALSMLKEARRLGMVNAEGPYTPAGAATLKKHQKES